jgi:transcriptional regulator GlxA family with amidase domain
MYAAQAIHYLETRFREKIQIQQLAQDIGISRSYLTQLFKEEIGMSPRELLINIRMEHATEFLEKSNDPIQLVALECGYDDALAFSKAFKQRFGMSPSRYRKEKQKAARI